VQLRERGLHLFAPLASSPKQSRPHVRRGREASGEATSGRKEANHLSKNQTSRAAPPALSPCCHSKFQHRYDTGGSSLRGQLSVHFTALVDVESPNEARVAGQSECSCDTDDPLCRCRRLIQSARPDRQTAFRNKAPRESTLRSGGQRIGQPQEHLWRRERCRSRNPLSWEVPGVSRFVRCFRCGMACSLALVISQDVSRVCLGSS
jgi:hypothetical protein